MTCELAPSILSSPFGRLQTTVREMIAAGCERIHLDVMDGQFVPPITFGAKMARDLNEGQGYFEAHLMTLTPEKHFEAFVEAGCKGVIFHVEASEHAHRLLQSLKAMNVQAGIALNPATPIEFAVELSEIADLVLLMTVNPGWGGQKFIESVLPKIERLREAAPTIDIEVDGGIDPDNLKRCREAGANVFVAGSFLESRGSIAHAVQELRAACV